MENYEELLLLNKNDHRKFLQRSLHHIKYSHIPDQDDIVRDVYQHILKVHLYSPELFTEKARSFLSEQEYIIKFWGYLVETVFRSSGVMAHWGDTISSYSIKDGTLAKMNLRLINISDDGLKEALDVGNAEFANKETESKYYKDLLEAIISLKVHLNELVTNFPGMTQEKVKNLQMPLCVVTGTTCYVYALYLESRNLYILEDVCSMSIPLSLKELKEGGISELLKNLLILKKFSLNTKAMVVEKDDLLRAAKVPVIAKNRKSPKAENKCNTLNWCKELWLPPPPMDDDDNVE